MVKMIAVMAVMRKPVIVQKVHVMLHNLLVLILLDVSHHDTNVMEIMIVEMEVMRTQDMDVVQRNVMWIHNSRKLTFC